MAAEVLLFGVTGCIVDQRDGGGPVDGLPVWGKSHPLVSLDAGLRQAEASNACFRDRDPEAEGTRGAGTLAQVCLDPEAPGRALEQGDKARVGTAVVAKEAEESLQSIKRAREAG